jgi:hypothetical protein
MSLLGLHRYGENSRACFLDICKEADYHLANASSLKNGGDAGLLLWLTALVCPEKCESFFKTLNDRDLVNGYSDTKQLRTMELSWILTGLSYGALYNASFKKKTADSAHRVFSLIKSNYGGKGIFKHQPSLSIRSWTHSTMGSFADQVYPIYAFSAYSRIYGNTEAAGIALACAETICKLQGPLGQWWWHYNPGNGTVVGRYPVYSVHQEAMAPMALFAVEKTTGCDFSKEIYKGLNWITGRNELGISMIDEQRNIVWRNFHCDQLKMRSEEFLTLIGLQMKMKDRTELNILYECWSYELGWLLYAFA